MSRFAEKEDDVAGMTFAEITVKHGEEAAVEAGQDNGTRTVTDIRNIGNAVRVSLADP